jgi:hypothetical protein
MVISTAYGAISRTSELTRAGAGAVPGKNIQKFRDSGPGGTPLPLHPDHDSKGVISWTKKTKGIENL